MEDLHDIEERQPFRREIHPGKNRVRTLLGTKADGNAGSVCEELDNKSNDCRRC